MIEIPLTTDPEQIFSMAIDNISYDFKVVLNSRQQVWYMSISQGGTCLIAGIALLGGSDLLVQHNLAIKNMFILNLENPTEDPTATSLGDTSKLYILTDSELGLDV